MSVFCDWARWQRRAATQSCWQRIWRRASRLCWTGQARSIRCRRQVRCPQNAEHAREFGLSIPVFSSMSPLKSMTRWCPPPSASVLMSSHHGACERCSSKVTTKALPLRCAGKKAQDESAQLRRSAMAATRAGVAGAACGSHITMSLQQHLRRAAVKPLGLQLTVLQWNRSPLAGRM